MDSPLLTIQVSRNLQKARSPVRKAIWALIWWIGIFVFISGSKWIRDLGVPLNVFNYIWMIIILNVGFQIATLAWEMHLKQRGRESSSAESVLSADPRPPIVYFRSFEMDKQPQQGLADAVLYTEEEGLADAVRQFSPFIAIGQPGQDPPLPGAARKYVDTLEWQQVVTDWIRGAQLVIIKASNSGGLWWEIETAGKPLPPEKIVILVDLPADKYEIFLSKARARFPYQLPSLTYNWFYFNNIRRVTYYDRQGAPKTCPKWVSLNELLIAMLSAEMCEDCPRSSKGGNQDFLQNLLTDECDRSKESDLDHPIEQEKECKGLSSSEVQKRHWLLTMYLSFLFLRDSISVVAGILFTIVYPESIFEDPLFFSFAFVVDMMNLVGTVALFKWKKWGFILFICANFIMGLVHMGAGRLPNALYGCLAHIVLLYLALNFGKERAAWPRLV